MYKMLYNILRMDCVDVSRGPNGNERKKVQVWSRIEVLLLPTSVSHGAGMCYIIRG